jgi:hypothetical protein
VIDAETLLAGMLRELAACSVDCTVGPFMLSAWNQMRGTGKQLVPDEVLLLWVKLFEGAIEHAAPALLVASGGDERRFCSALAFVLESVANVELDAVDSDAAKIAQGTLALDTALRARELGLPGFRHGTDDGPATLAGISDPSFLAWDGAGGLYFCDVYKVRWLDLQRRFVVTCIAGTR